MVEGEGGLQDPVHVSLTEYSSKIKIIKNFKMRSAEIKSQAWGPLLSTGLFATVPITPS